LTFNLFLLLTRFASPDASDVVSPGSDISPSPFTSTTARSTIPVFEPVTKPPQPTAFKPGLVLTIAKISESDVRPERTSPLSDRKNTISPLKLVFNPGLGHKERLGRI